MLTDGRTGEEFWASGEAEVADRLATIQSLGLTTAGHALDFGCGIGRLTLALGRRFSRVTGVDHSPAMVSRARQRATAAGLVNIEFVVSENDRIPNLADRSIDFAFSRLVFQHMPGWEVVVDNLRELARVLKPGGLAWVQFDTRPAGVLYRAWNFFEPLLPRWLGPDTWRAPLRRYRRRAVDLDRLFAELDLEIPCEQGRNTEAHEYLLRRPR